MFFGPMYATPIWSDYYRSDAAADEHPQAPRKPLPGLGDALSAAKQWFVRHKSSRGAKRQPGASAEPQPSPPSSGDGCLPQRSAPAFSAHAHTRRAPSAAAPDTPLPCDAMPPPSPNDDGVPTFADAHGWHWMLPRCVSPYLLLQSLAARTKTPGQPGGAFEAHAMGMLYNGPVHLWEYREGDMRARTVGPESLAAHEQAHAPQHVACIDGRWVAYNPEARLAEPASAGPAADSLYEVLLRGYSGRTPTASEIAECRAALAASVVAESNRERFAERALDATQAAWCTFAEADPAAAQSLRERAAGRPAERVPGFWWNGEKWPHPACAAPCDLLELVTGSIGRLGVWGSELEASVAAEANNWRVHIWKPRDPGDRSRRAQYDRVLVCGPRNGRPRHVVNIIENCHYAKFTPDLQTSDPAATALSATGRVEDCGSEGNCLYLSLLGYRGADCDVKPLRDSIVDYIRKHPRRYEAVAGSALDLWWNAFSASYPQAAARLTERAQAFCDRRLRRAHPG